MADSDLYFEKNIQGINLETILERGRSLLQTRQEDFTVLRVKVDAALTKIVTLSRGEVRRFHKGLERETL